MTRKQNGKKKPTNLPIILSLGGSAICPQQIDLQFLKGFREFIAQEISLGNRFVIVCGGGAVARTYIAAFNTFMQDHIHQQHTKQPNSISNMQQQKNIAYKADLLGIDATLINARLVQAILGDLAEQSICMNPLRANKNAKKVIVACGWKPGASSDNVAVRLAKTLGSKNVINISNIPCVYDKDPRAHPDATPVTSISWSAYVRIIDPVRSPGMNVPFDPVASAFCKKNRMRVIVCNTDLPNIHNILHGKQFKGTTISPDGAP